MKNIKKGFLMTGMMMCLLACNPFKKHYYERNDKDLTLQLMLDDAVKDSGDVSMKIRILPTPAEIEKADLRDKDKFYYHMDSCFYLNVRKQKIYAALVEPVANGVKNSYEYLLSFEAVAAKNDSLSFVYQDRYMNKKTYRIKIN